MLKHVWAHITRLTGLMRTLRQMSPCAVCNCRQVLHYLTINSLFLISKSRFLSVSALSVDSMVFIKAFTGGEPVIKMS